MRQQFTAKIKRVGSKDEYAECMFYVDETPHFLLRGKNKAGKRRRGKRAIELARHPPVLKQRGRHDNAIMEQ